MRERTRGLRDSELPEKVDRHNTLLDRCLPAEVVLAARQMARIQAMSVYQRDQVQKISIRSMTAAEEKYLREIRQYPLLTREDEINLAKSMERGKWARAISRGTAAAKSLIHAAHQVDIPTLKALVEAGKEAGVALGLAKENENVDLIGLPERTAQELEEIDTQAREARDKLIVSNLRLVVYIARWYANRGLSFLDLIQEGNIGLMKAVEKFDYKRGFKLSTYAAWWIRQTITRAIVVQSGMIRLPSHVIQKVRKVRKARQEYIDQHESTPTVEELSELVGMDVLEIDEIEKLPMTIPILDRVIRKEDGTECVIEDLIIDCLSPAPPIGAYRILCNEHLQHALDQLEEIEGEIVRMRYGLEGSYDWTLKKVSVRFNITRERVRQIEIKGIMKLKHPSRRTELKRLRECICQSERELCAGAYYGRSQKRTK